MRRLTPVSASSTLWADLVVIATTTWMGVHVLRSFVAQLGFIVGANLAFNQTVGLLFGVWCLGILLWPVHRWWKSPTPGRRAGIIFAVVYAVTIALRLPGIVPLLAAVSTVAWVWYVPTLVEGLGRQGRAHRLAPGVLLGFACQAALQAALHGLDLATMRGLWPGLLAGALALLLVVGLTFGSPGQPRTVGTVDSMPGWGLIALSPFFALQMIMFSNLGQVSAWTGWPLAAAAGLVLGALACGLAVQAWRAPYWARALGALGAVALLAQPGRFAGAGAWLLIPAQVYLSLALPAALTPVAPGRRSPFYLIAAIGTLIFFVLFLGQHTLGANPYFWLLLGGLTVLPALLPVRSASVEGVRPAVVGAVAVSLAGLAICLTPRAGAPGQGPAPSELEVLTYNIHAAYDVSGTPTADQIARIIEESGADFVGLQEVARGLDVLGGADLVAYLTWRLPQYHLVYGPASGSRQGNLLLSRHPVKESGSIRFPLRVSSEQRGLTWATVAAAGGDVTFAVTHWSAFADEEADRLGQAGDVLAFWAQRPRFLLVGDLNRSPDGEPIGRLVTAGLVNASASAPLGAQPTFPAHQPTERLDYVFASSDMSALHADRLPEQASDHLAVLVKVRLP